MTEPVPDPRSAVLRKASAVGLVLVLMAVQFSIGVAHALFALTLIGWIALLIVERRRPQAPRFAIPPGPVCGADARVRDPVDRPDDERDRQPAAFPVSARADDLRPDHQRVGRQRGNGGLERWSGQRPGRNWPVRHPELQPRSAAARHARHVHDVLGPDDADRVPGGRAGAVRAQRADVGRTGRPGAGGCSRGDVHAEHVDWRLLGGRRAVPDEGFPSPRDPAGGRGGVLPRRAGRHPAAVRVDLRSARSQQSRSPGDGRGRRPYRSRPPVDRRRSRHGAARLPALPHGGRCARDAAPSPQRPGAGRRRARTPCAGGLVLVRGRRGARLEASVRLAGRAGGGCQPPAWPRSSRWSQPACSSTTSAIPSS